MKNKKDELVSLFYDKDEEEQRIRNGIMKEIKRKALAEGKLQTKKEMIINMYNKGYEISDIADISGITIDEVKNIVGIK